MQRVAVSFIKHCLEVSWLFSTNQIEIVETLVPTMLAKGYTHYVAYTNTNTGSYYNSEPDLYIIFSNEEISGSSAYSFNIPSNSVRVVVRSSNYSSSTSAVNTERIVTEEYTATTLNVDVYEHIYTNAVFTGSSVQPDILQEGSANTIYDTYNSVILTAILFFIVLWEMWKVRK